MTKKKPIRKSEKLTPAEHEAFKEVIDGIDTKTEASEIFKLNRAVIDRVYYVGSGKPTTIKAIRKQIA